MYNNIISQNVKLMDEKLEIIGKQFEIIKGVIKNQNNQGTKSDVKLFE